MNNFLIYGILMLGTFTRYLYSLVRSFDERQGMNTIDIKLYRLNHWKLSMSINFDFISFLFQAVYTA